MLLKLLKKCHAKKNGKPSNSALICRKILYHVLGFFSFGYHLQVTRRLSKSFKVFTEAKIAKFCPVRFLHYNMAPGFIYPTRNNKILQLPNIVQLTLYHYFPDYNQWIFNYILNREFHLTIDTLNHRRTTFCYTLFKYKKIKVLTLKNTHIVGLYLNGIIANAENIVFMNVVFLKIDREIVKSDCVNFTMDSCSNLHHLNNSRFVNATHVTITRTDISKDVFKVFSGEAVTNLIINYSPSCDDELIRYLTVDSPFKKI